ncbi:MAG TPA: hypothetical protein VGK30_04785 [Candidatus Binatia bacterium]|jgi:hypothetical protein
MATLLEAPLTAPLWILDGSIEVGERVFGNLLPIPFDHQGPVVVKLNGATGRPHATGIGASLTLLGNPVFVENVPADDEPLYVLWRDTGSRCDAPPPDTIKDHGARDGTAISGMSPVGSPRCDTRGGWRATMK